MQIPKDKSRWFNFFQRVVYFFHHHTKYLYNKYLIIDFQLSFESENIQSRRYEIFCFNNSFYELSHNFKRITFKIKL